MRYTAGLFPPDWPYAGPDPHKTVFLMTTRSDLLVVWNVGVAELLRQGSTHRIYLCVLHRPASPPERPKDIMSRLKALYGQAAAGSYVVSARRGRTLISVSSSSGITKSPDP